MKRFARWPFRGQPKVPDYIEPDRCYRCKAHSLTKKAHRPCFQVGCYCHCSHVPGYIA